MTKNIDPGNMFGAVWDFPENLSDALKLAEQIGLTCNYENIENIVVAGMGGSAIGGDVVSILEKNNLEIPFVVSRGYGLPNWVNDHTLVICSSYSGNTEETLCTLDDAIEKKAKICGITTGGKLAERLDELDKDVILIPSGLQPRAALAFSFVPMIVLLEKVGVLDSSLRQWFNGSVAQLQDSRVLYGKENESNPTYALAQKIKNRIPIIYSDSSTMGIAAVRLKGQISENGKMLAYHNELPEFNHNEIVGWENNPELLESLFVLWLIDSSDNPRVKHRQSITKSILDEVGVDQVVLEMAEKSFEERFLHMIHFGDWLSYWCAILHETDPSPVEKITSLKYQLSKKK